MSHLGSTRDSESMRMTVMMRMRRRRIRRRRTRVRMMASIEIRWLTFKIYSFYQYSTSRVSFLAHRTILAIGNLFR